MTQEKTSRRTHIPACLAVALFAGSALAQPAEAADLAALEDIVATGEAAEIAYEKHILRLDVAERIAKACFEYAQDNGFRVSTHIVDQFGYTIYAARMDGQQADNVETCEMKAQTALYFREPTRVWAERAQQSPYMGQLLAQMGQFPVPGGLPIIVDNELVGAIGVGGATSDQDEDCARAGLVAVLGPQPYLVGSGQ